jgi:S-adenosylmethionine decarboxylase proenzyme
LPASLLTQEARSKRLYTIDAGLIDRSLLTAPEAVVVSARSAVAAGGGHILDEALVVFPNRAFTLVLVLAESHLCVHTWPEEGLVAVDLFSCGAIDGGAVVDSLRRDLGLREVVVRQVRRGLGAADAR